MKSKKKLFEALAHYFNNTEYTEKGLQAEGISNETYGRKSCIYIKTPSPEDRRNLEGFLGIRGFNINSKYWPGSSTLEVHVSYFKGHQWNT